MLRLNRSVCVLLAALPLACLSRATPSHAYIDLAPTLAKIISDSQRISVAEVVRFTRESRVVVLKEIRSLKGEMSSDLVQHMVAAAPGAAVARPILQWATPGARAVLFVSRNAALVCVGEGWYQVRAAGSGPWKLAKDRPDLPLAYFGPVSRLAQSVGLMVAGKDAVLTVVAHGESDEAASFDLALNRFSTPGLVRIQRIRANLQMPPMVMAVSRNPAYAIGPGPVDEGYVAPGTSAC